MGVTPNLVPAEHYSMRGVGKWQRRTKRTGTTQPEPVPARPMAATTKPARRSCSSRGLTFELSGPMRWTAGPAWCNISERTTQALTAAVAGPLERGVRPERDWVKSVRRVRTTCLGSKKLKDSAFRCAAWVLPNVTSGERFPSGLGEYLGACQSRGPTDGCRSAQRYRDSKPCLRSPWLRLPNVRANPVYRRA